MPSLDELALALRQLRSHGLCGERLADACENARCALQGGALHGRGIDDLSPAALTFAAGPRLDDAAARAFRCLFRAYWADEGALRAFAREALGALDLFLDVEGQA